MHTVVPVHCSGHHDPFNDQEEDKLAKTDIPGIPEELKYIDSYLSVLIVSASISVFSLFKSRWLS